MIAFLENFRQDLQFGFRMMARQPGFTAMAVLALVIGIGFVTGQFIVLNGFFLRPLPFDESDRLLVLSPVGGSDLAHRNKMEMFNLDSFLQFRGRQTAFEGMIGGSLGTINVSDGTFAQRYDGSFITHNFDEVLRIGPALGRGFDEADARSGAEPVILISHAVWMRDFSGDPGIADRPVMINSRPGRIIGVMPPGFHFPEKEDVWMALAEDARAGDANGDLMVKAIGRLRDGVSMDQAQVDADAAIVSMAESLPDYLGQVDRVHLESIQASVIGATTVKTLWVMMLAVVFILLIACANVANLLLARSAARGRELAIRSALGATRRRIIMQMLSESLVLCLLGAAGGVIFSVWTNDWLAGLIRAAQLPYWIDLSFDGRILSFVCLVTVASALISGFVPAWKASSLDVNLMLKDGGRSISGLHLGVFTKVLIIVQVSLSFALLILAGLMLQSVNVQASAGLPFKPDDVLAARFGLFVGEYPKDEDVIRFATELSDRLADYKGIAGASVTTRQEFFPSAEWLFRTTAMADEQEGFPARADSILPGYFKAIGTALVAGRDFTPEDTAASEAVVIVNESFGRLHWPEGPVLGRLVGIQREDGEEHVWASVVGVAPDLQMEGFQAGTGGGTGSRAGLYLPLSQKSSRFMTVVLRGDAGIESRSLVPILQQTVHALDPNLPLYWVRTLQESIDLSLTGNRIITSMFIWFGLAALFLAAMGIFAVVTFSVNQRRVEIGIRMALGARVSDIKALVVRQGFLQLLVGLGLGSLVSVALSSLLRSALIGIRTDDSVTYLLSMVILTLVSTAAWILPVRKAVRVDPMIALRDE